jgi:hypothetical protein
MSFARVLVQKARIAPADSLKCRPQPRSLGRVSPRPDPFPFEQHVRKASGSGARRAPATIEHHISAPAGRTCTRSCDFRIDDQLAIRSFQHRQPAWMDGALDYAAKSTDPSAQLSRAGQRKHYDGVPVRRIEAVCVYDRAFDDFTLSASVARSCISYPHRATSESS